MHMRTYQDIKKKPLQQCSLGAMASKRLKTIARNPTISIYFAGLLGRWSHRPSIWWSKYYFDRLKIKQCTEVRFTSFLSGGFITAIVVNPTERNFPRNYEKITILNIEDWWILDASCNFFLLLTWKSAKNQRIVYEPRLM